MTEILIIIVVLNLIGTILNMLKNKWGFIIWAITNVGFAIIDYKVGLVPQAALLAFYSVLSLYGFYRWHMEDKNRLR